jgi:hypothetical protein
MNRGEYARSLKSTDSEELLDLLLFRPAAFVLVKAIARFPVTPNQVSLLSLALGLAAAWEFSLGSRTAMGWGALLYALANLLDCADGQLARLQKSGTLLGRVVDGTADYISGIAVFTGLGVGLSATGAPAWPLVIVAAISTSLHAIFFDHYQSQFLSSAAGEPDFIGREIDRFGSEIRRLRDERGSALRLQLLRGYLSYLGVQKRIARAVTQPGHSSAGRPGHGVSMIRLWSFLGPTTNRTLLIACALFGRVELYLWLVAGAGNAWLMVASILQAGIRSVPPGENR